MSGGVSLPVVPEEGQQTDLITTRNTHKHQLIIQSISLCRIILFSHHCVCVCNDRLLGGLSLCTNTCKSDVRCVHVMIK